MSVSSFPEMYERWLVGPLFRPFAEVLVERAHLAAGDRVLDIACGTGIAARLAKERVGHSPVVGIDASPQMLDVARTIAPEIEWRTGNAGALPLKKGESFDVVFCHQGLQFFPDRAAALREMKRVLTPGGRLVAGVWRSLEESPFLRESYHIAQRQLGSFVDRRHSFADPDALEHLIRQAGFHHVHVEQLTRVIRFADPTAFVRMNTMALVGMGGAPTGTDEERATLVADIVAASAAVVRQYSDVDGLAFELSANVATAHTT
jgi:ubiquinone/menaquinone biosynthesis C-methylase UbiE